MKTSGVVSLEKRPRGTLVSEGRTLVGVGWLAMKRDHARFTQRRQSIRRRNLKKKTHQHQTQNTIDKLWNKKKQPKNTSKPKTTTKPTRTHLLPFKNPPGPETSRISMANCRWGCKLSATSTSVYSMGPRVRRRRCWGSKSSLKRDMAMKFSPRFLPNASLAALYMFFR